MRTQVRPSWDRRESLLFDEQRIARHGWTTAWEEVKGSVMMVAAAVVVVVVSCKTLVEEVEVR